MSFLRPATPGFVVTLTATILLAIVTFCVPYIKSVFFLRASIAEGGFSGSIIFGTLGYCLELSNGTTCSKPSVGYELDINGLVGNKLPIEIPQVVVKWITYALVLHIVALIAAAGSAVFGLLAHCREMSMACCSTCISGFAAVIALLAFIFDLILFFVAKARINSIGSAQIGSAIWLTLAAWILLFFSGCFYSVGRCCISQRPTNRRSPGGDTKTGDNKNLDQQRLLDSVKAEADRKADQRRVEGGLPQWPKTPPLTGIVHGDHVDIDYPTSGGHPAGYVQGPGDEYHYPPPPPQASSYSGVPLSTSRHYPTPNSLLDPPMPTTQYDANSPYSTPPLPLQSRHTPGGDNYGASAYPYSLQSRYTPGDNYEAPANPYSTSPPPLQNRYTLGNNYEAPANPYSTSPPPLQNRYTLGNNYEAPANPYSTLPPPLQNQRSYGNDYKVPSDYDGALVTHR